MILASNGQSETARRRRRMFPIHFYTGRNGGAKSLCAVYDTLPTLEAGRPVLSTVRLLDYVNPRPCDDDSCDDVMHPDHGAAHPLYTPFRNWEQLLDWRLGDVIMDEITGVADSNDSASMPAAVRNKLPQLRRHDVALRITGLNWIRADKRIREACNAVTRCRTTLATSARSGDGQDRLWRPRRLALWVTYDAQSLPVDDHTDQAYRQADRLCAGRHWIPTSPAIAAYDTLAPVATVGTVTDAGRCAYCGGTRRPAECSCHDYVTDRASRKEHAAAAGTKSRSRAGSHDPHDGHGRHVHSAA